MKNLEFRLRIMRIMEILEFHAIIIKKNEIQIILYDNHEINENHRI